jgi:hypothetical protein
MSPEQIEFIIEDWSSHVRGLANMYGLELDETEKSVETIEKIAAGIHRNITKVSFNNFYKKIFKKKLFDDNIDKVSKMLVSQLGKIIVGNLGGSWIYDESFNTPGIVFPNNNRCFPITKVYKRIIDGEGDNIEFFYKVTKQNISTGRPLTEAHPSNRVEVINLSGNIDKN